MTIPKNSLHEALVPYMLYNNTRYVALLAPRAIPEFFNKELNIPFNKRFPDIYVHEFESLIAQSDIQKNIIHINPRDGRCKIEYISRDKDKYESALLSFFIQSVQEINPQSKILYDMAGISPKRRSKNITSSGTNHCCFKKIVVKMVSAPVDDTSNCIKLVLMIQDHVNHKKDLNVSALNKWLCWNQ